MSAIFGYTYVGELAKNVGLSLVLVKNGVSLTVTPHYIGSSRILRAHRSLKIFGILRFSQKALESCTHIASLTICRGGFTDHVSQFSKPVRGNYVQMQFFQDMLENNRF